MKHKSKNGVRAYDAQSCTTKSVITISCHAGYAMDMSFELSHRLSGNTQEGAVSFSDKNKT